MDKEELMTHREGPHTEERVVMDRNESMPAIVDLAVDIMVEGRSIRNSFIREICGDTIVLVQTFPPFDERHIGTVILVTYVTQQHECRRYGFNAEILEVREGYETVGRGFPAIVARKISGIFEHDLRAHKRTVSPAGLRILLGGASWDIVDISMEGTHIVGKSREAGLIHTGDTLFLTLEINALRIQREARVMRIWHTKGARGPTHLALTFLQEVPEIACAAKANGDPHAGRHKRDLFSPGWKATVYDFPKKS
ncbi:MAG: hypothetical protein JXO48_09315 [Deltaproteobacteria bacterium]|nr:hypothetical protein [Deltaproteobacteria bacterium]